MSYTRLDDLYSLHNRLVDDYNDPDKPFEQTEEDRLLTYDLIEKIEDGLLVELPCNVGTTVYCIVRCFEGFFKRKFVYDIVEYPFEIGMVDTYKIDWFLTEGEAEARLKELQEGKK